MPCRMKIAKASEVAGIGISRLNEFVVNSKRLGDPGMGINIKESNKIYC